MIHHHCCSSFDSFDQNKIGYETAKRLANDLPAIDVDVVFEYRYSDQCFTISYAIATIHHGKVGDRIHSYSISDHI
jgi:hypothetical protein